MINISVPAELSALIAGYTAQPVTLGMSGAMVYRLTQTGAPTLFLKVFHDRADQNGKQEYERLRWMRHKLPVPAVHSFVEQAGVSYLLMVGIPGADASDERYRTNMPQLVRLLAQGLRMIHTVPMRDCVFDYSTGTMLARAQARLAQGLVDETDFDAERQGRGAAELFVELVASRPAADDLVFAHGDYCLPNVVIDNDVISGFIDVGRAGISDRYRDLALAARSLVYNGYPDGVALLFAEYGLAPDPAKIAFFQLMDEFF